MKYVLTMILAIFLLSGSAFAQEEVPAWIKEAAPEEIEVIEAAPIIEVAPTVEAEEEYVTTEEAEEEIEEAEVEEPKVTKALETSTWLGMGFAGRCITVDSEWSRDINEKMRLAFCAGWGLRDFYTVTKLTAGVNHIIREVPWETMGGIIELYGGAKLSYANYTMDVQDLILVGTARSGGIYGLGATLGARYDTLRIETGLDTALGLVFFIENRFILH